METKFKFNSQICTSREQSERLLALGLKSETADMHWYKPAECEHDYWYVGVGESWATSDIPAWSLHRLIEIVPSTINEMLWFNATDTVLYDSLNYIKTFDVNDNLYGNIIDCIEWLIKEGYFNKEYLEDKK